MPQAIPVPVRQAIIQRRQQGHTLRAIAEEFHVSLVTVRKLWRRVRDQGPDALPPDYPRCGRTQPRGDARLIRAACWLKRRHPTWGVVFIGLQLQQKWPDRPRPPERTLQRWFRRAGVNRTPVRPPPQDRRRGMAPHEVWQVDAVEKQRLADGHQASWLTVTDEASGAILTAELSPQDQWQEIEPAAVQAMLRRVFQRWGLPDRLRVDNGHPWGSQNDLPTDLALWLIGLGVNLIWNKPRCPQMNGMVERSQGVTQQWVEPQTLADSTRLQARLNWAVHIQRELDPAVAGRSRLAAFPAWATPRRRYQIEIEDALWSLDRVDLFLAQGVWRRRVGRSGQIALDARDDWVGKRQTGQDVSVQFDPTDRHWVVCDHRGQELRRHRAEQLTRERIVGLKVAHRPAQ